MKIAVLILSLVANAGLGWVVVHRSETKVPAAATATATAKETGIAEKGNTAAAAATLGLTAAEAAALKNAWPKNHAGDFKALLATLRAQGFPEETVRAIVRALAGEKFRARYQELVVGEDGPFWKTPSAYRDPQRANAIRSVYRDEKKEIRDLLGPGDAPEVSDLAAAQLLRKFGDLPAAKAQRADQVLRDFNELSSNIFFASQGGAYAGGPIILLPEEREKLAALEKQKRAALAEVLSPDELLDYDLRTSSSANTLRRTLMGFDPTEEEFRTLFKLQQGVNDQLGLVNGPTNIDQFRQQQAALKALQPQIEAALDPDRLAAYKQATDPQYATVNRLVARLELPPTAAVEVVNVQKDIQKQAALLRANQTLTPEDRAAQLNTLADDADRRLAAALGGGRGLEAYKQYSGSWLQTLKASQPARVRTP